MSAIVVNVDVARVRVLALLSSRSEVDRRTSMKERQNVVALRNPNDCRHRSLGRLYRSCTSFKSSSSRGSAAVRIPFLKKRTPPCVILATTASFEHVLRYAAERAQLLQIKLQHDAKYMHMISQAVRFVRRGSRFLKFLCFTLQSLFKSGRLNGKSWNLGA